MKHIAEAAIYQTNLSETKKNIQVWLRETRRFARAQRTLAKV